MRDEYQVCFCLCTSLSTYFLKWWDCKTLDASHSFFITAQCSPSKHIGHPRWSDENWERVHLPWKMQPPNPRLPQGQLQTMAYCHSYRKYIFLECTRDWSRWKKQEKQNQETVRKCRGRHWWPFKDKTLRRGDALPADGFPMAGSLDGARSRKDERFEQIQSIVFIQCKVTNLTSSWSAF